MDVSSDPYALFQEDLRPGERLLWTGQPNPNKVVTWADGCAVPFSLLWGGFAFYWEYMVVSQYIKSRGTMPIIMPLWGIPFCLIGMYLIFGRFIILSLQRKRTFYAVTDQRLIFLIAGRTRKVQYIPLDRELSIQKNIRSDGSGTLMFGNSKMPPWMCSMATSRTGATQLPGFMEIRDADEVARLIDRRQAVLPRSAPAAG